MLERKILTALPPSYDVEFDLQNPNPALIRKNLEADLGERFNVQISQVEFIFDGPFLKSTQMAEPFIETIKKGIQHRQKYAGSHDRRRELAEFENFNKVQTYFGQDDDPDTCVITISPRGPRDSCYQHNFFDIYQRDQDGKIIMRRYSSQMTIDQFAEAAKQIDSDFEPEAPVDDVYFLQNPLKTKLSIDQILAILHPDQTALKVEDLQALRTACGPLIDDYIEDRSRRRYRALLNFADDFILKPKERKQLRLKLQNPDLLPMLSAQLAARPVRQVITGCGSQGDQWSTVNGQLSVVNLMPFSVAEFADNYFNCPRCGGQIESGRGITTCPHCGLTKEQAGSKC